MNAGDRVQRKGQTFCGIVRDISATGMVHVWWGTKTQHEGKPGMEVLEWIPTDELELWPHTVVTAKEIAERELCRREREIKKP